MAISSFRSAGHFLIQIFWTWGTHGRRMVATETLGRSLLKDTKRGKTIGKWWFNGGLMGF